MASQEDIWQLIVKTVGAEDLKKLEAGLEDLNKTAAKIPETSDKAAKGSANMGRVALEASRGLEDLQYGVAGVVNNIPSLVMALGGTAGLTAAISLLAVGANQLVKHWPELMEMFGNTKPIQDAAAETKKLEAEIKKLEDKKIKLAVDYADLERARKALKDLTAAEAERERQKNQQKASEAEAGKLIQDLLTESEEGADEVQRRTVAAFAQRSISQSATIAGLDEEIKKQKERLAIATDPDMISNAKELIRLAREQRQAAADVITDKAGTAYGGLLAKAKTGSGVDQRKAREDLATLIGGAGFGPLAAAIAGTTPEGLEAGDKETAEFERRMGRATTAGEMRRSKAAIAKKQAADADKVKKDKIREAMEQSQAIEADAQKTAADARRAATERRQAEHTRQQLAREANKPALEREARTIKQGGFAEQAELALAQAQAAGIGPDRRFGMVQQQAARQLGQQFPGMGAQQRGDMATQIAAMGQQGLNQRMADLAAQGVNVNQRTQAAMEKALQAVQRLANQMNGMGAHADQMGRGFRQVGDFAQGMPGMPGAQNAGW